MWIYSISSAMLYTDMIKPDRSRLAVCPGYSGDDSRLNDPNNCSNPGGPPPVGQYFISGGYWDEVYGPDAIVITPHQGTDLLGRQGIFTIHGSLAGKKNESAGSNSIVLPVKTRKWIIYSGDTRLLIEK